MKSVYVLLLGLALSTVAMAQKQVLTLQQCVDIALEKNLTIQQAANTAKIAHEDALQSRLNYIPTVTANVNATGNFGTTFDQVLFARVERTTWTSSPQLQAQLPLYAGLSRFYTYQQNKNNEQAAIQALARNKNTVITNVITGYLAVLVDKSNVKISQDRIELLKRQQDIETRRYEAGAGVYANVLNIGSQLAVEEQNLITQQNLFERDRLSLLQLLQLNITGSQASDYDFADVDPARLGVQQLLSESVPALNQVEANALATMPEIKEQELRMSAANYSQKNAWGGMMPTLTLTAGINSFYSSNGGTFEASGVSYNPFTVFDASGNNPMVLGYRSSVEGGLIRTSYFPQLKDNLAQFVTFNLNIPIFTGWQRRRNFQVAKLNNDNARIEYERSRNDLIFRVRQAHLDVVASRTRFESLERQIAASKEAYNVAETRFNAGQDNFFTYIDALNNLNRLQLQQTQATYEFYFRKKVLDFFNGKPIDFK